MHEFFGILNIDKPAGVTSRDVVNTCVGLLRQQFPQSIKCGHAGTLDPLATGVLLVCTGQATRLVSILQEFPKTYRAGFTLGAHSDTDDSSGQIVQRDVLVPPDREAVLQALESRLGTIQQRPPDYSAVKVAGRRAYRLARGGQAVDIRPRTVTIHKIELHEYQYPFLTVTVQCGSGTYIRSIARDVGDQLGCGGLMHELKRTAIGPFRLDDAIQLDTPDLDIGGQLNSPISAFPGICQWTPDDQQLLMLRDGKRLRLSGYQQHRLLAVGAGGEFLALLERNETQDQYRPLINWVPTLLEKQRQRTE